MYMVKVTLRGEQVDFARRNDYYSSTPGPAPAAQEVWHPAASPSVPVLL